MSFQYISNLHFIYFSNKMDRILEAESCNFSRIALGLYQRSTFLRNFHYGTGNVSPNNTDFQKFPIISQAYIQDSNLIQSKNIISFIHSNTIFQPLLCTKQVLVSQCLKSESLPTLHTHVHLNTCFQTNALALLSDILTPGRKSPHQSAILRSFTKEKFSFHTHSK